MEIDIFLVEINRDEDFRIDLLFARKKEGKKEEFYFTINVINKLKHGRILNYR